MCTHILWGLCHIWHDAYISLFVCAATIPHQCTTLHNHLQGWTDGRLFLPTRSSGSILISSRVSSCACLERFGWGTLLSCLIFSCNFCFSDRRIVSSTGSYLALLGLACSLIDTFVVVITSAKLCFWVSVDNFIPPNVKFCNPFCLSVFKICLRNLSWVSSNARHSLSKQLPVLTLMSSTLVKPPPLSCRSRV